MQFYEFMIKLIKLKIALIDKCSTQEENLYGLITRISLEVERLQLCRTWRISSVLKETSESSGVIEEGDVDDGAVVKENRTVKQYGKLWGERRTGEVAPASKILIEAPV